MNSKKLFSWKVLAGALTAGLILAFGGSYLAAKYVHQRDNDGQVRAKEYYFTSDLLDGETHTLSEGSTSFTFHLGNHADDLRYSEMDVAYVVKVEKIAGAGSSIPVLTKGTGTLSSGSITDQAVVVSGLDPGSTYRITANGNGGYHSVLTGTVYVPETLSEVYKHLDTSNPDFVILTVWSKGYSGNITITPPAMLIPDNTDPVMNTAVKGSAFTDTTSFTADGNDHGYRSHKYRFFGNADVDESDFSVVYGSEKSAQKADPEE